MTTGAGSNFQLTRLAAKVNEVQHDGRLLSNRRAMDVVWIRVQQLAGRIDMNEAPERLAKLQRLWVKFREAEDAGRLVEAKLIEADIDNEFEKAYHDYAAWKQMFEALDLHSSMVEKEVKIMKDLHAIVTAEQANDMMAKVMAVFLRVLQGDAKRLKQAQYELSRLTGYTIDAEFDTGFGEGSGESGSSPRPDIVDGEGVPYPGNEGSPPETDGLPEGHTPGSLDEG